MRRSNLLFLIGCLLLLNSCSKAQPNATENGEDNPVAAAPNDSPFKNYLGINGFEWDFSDKDPSVLSPGRIEVMRSFGGFRHYMDWEKIEPEKGLYTFNPTHLGGWNYDMIYEKCSAEGIEMLADLKTAPDWLINTYPENSRDGENVPAPYGLNRSDPATYILQAKAGFQLAARYGHTQVDPALVTVNPAQRWTNDPINVVKIGLGYLNYIECDNERDKTWKGPLAYQNPEEYAANMSAFYDGHMGKLGKNVGVKTADPKMKVVMGGLSVSGPDYVEKMIAWCKKNRGLKADGTVNLCFDVINFHCYNNDYNDAIGASTIGKAPELGKAASVSDNFVAMSKKYANNTEVWITEAGYDVNPKSPQRAIAIGNKSALITQADWMLRSVFLYVRHGLKRSFFFMLDDVDINNDGQYSSSGFAVGHDRRPVADYFFQTKKLMGDFSFQKTLNADPIADVYGFNGRKIYALFVPDEKGRTANYTLDLGTAKSAKIYTLVPGATEVSTKTVATANGKLSITVTETPIFVE